MNIFSRFYQRIFPNKHPLPAGFYPYQSPPGAARPVRLHLRLEADGHGLLVLNASTVMHLNQTAAEMIYHFIKGTPENLAVAEMTTRYRVDGKQLEQDYKTLLEKLQTLMDTPDLEPVTYLDFDRQTPYEADISAPYRLDCALTYRTEDEGLGIAPQERVKRELTTEEWQIMLDKAFKAGIPQVIFTGGEPTLRPDLITLLAYGEKLGLVTGLLTGGARLSDPKYLHSLLQNGLDHILLVLEPDHEEAWEALKDILAEDIFVAVHLTVREGNAAQIMEMLEKLAKMGVKAVSLSAAAPELAEDLENARRAASGLEMSLVWDLPVPYSVHNPVALEMQAMAGEDERLTDGAGKAWLYVEPDGDVLPAQGRADQVMGSLLMDEWPAIWARRPQK
ncbi:MAG TPA: radical SAM protein [Anaerolineaceae bacterium]|nr:radical SAM protein [Anaerolineaceae bacterium]HPN53375.1 radical SAM protein [Anaerolineaceae bacterium]